MTFLDHCQQAYTNLSAAKLRSLLAVLGILVGTASVVALISCGQLATEKALQEFKALGTDLLAVSLYPKSPETSHNLDSQLSLEQWRQLPELVPTISSLAPYSTAYQPMSFQGQSLEGVIIGADNALAQIVKITLAQGNFVSFVDSYEHFCVIGDNVAQQIKNLTQDNPIGQQLRIGQALYSIIGVAKPWKENSFFNEDINHAVIIPIAGMVLVQKDSKMNNAVILLKPNSPIDPVITQIQNFLAAKAPSLTLYPRSAKQIIARMEKQGNIFTLLLGVIGCISLLVGGIGIMNVMLVSVSERKKEIGIRKAVGARDKEIQTLFLIEAALLALSGGFLGVVCGLIFTDIVAWFSNWPFKLYFLPPLAGFAVSVATGIFFGFYPARRASKLEPMVSLRSE